jgi:hypothetical protein
VYSRWHTASWSPAALNSTARALPVPASIASSISSLELVAVT